jgi:hypothetical protein
MPEILKGAVSTILSRRAFAPEALRYRATWRSICDRIAGGDGRDRFVRTDVYEQRIDLDEFAGNLGFSGRFSQR